MDKGVIKDIDMKYKIHKSAAQDAYDIFWIAKDLEHIRGTIFSIVHQ